MEIETNESSKRYIDGKTFQHQLDELATTIAFKVQREGAGHLPQPIFVTADIYYLLRQAQQTYNFFCFINADERRQKDVDYRIAYSAVTLPLVRTMIDCLYNITAILNDPGPKGYQFRESGVKQILEALDSDQQKYGGDPKWDVWIANRRKQLELEMRTTGLTEPEVRVAKLWPTLGGYPQDEEKHSTHGAPAVFEKAHLRVLAGIFWYFTRYFPRIAAHRQFPRTQGLTS